MDTNLGVLYLFPSWHHRGLIRRTESFSTSGANKRGKGWLLLHLQAWDTWTIFCKILWISFSQKDESVCLSWACKIHSLSLSADISCEHFILCPARANHLAAGLIKSLSLLTLMRSSYANSSTTTSLPSQIHHHHHFRLISLYQPRHYRCLESMGRIHIAAAAATLAAAAKTFWQDLIITHHLV